MTKYRIGYSLFVLLSVTTLFSRRQGGLHCNEVTTLFYRSFGMGAHGSPASVMSEFALIGGYELRRVANDRIPKFK